GDLCLILYICYSQPCTVERYCRRCLSCVRAVTCRIVNDRINLTTEIGCVDIVCQYICGNVIYRKRGSVLTQRMPPSPAEAVSVVSKSGRRIYISAYGHRCVHYQFCVAFNGIPQHCHLVLLVTDLGARRIRVNKFERRSKYYCHNSKSQGYLDQR